MHVYNEAWLPNAVQLAKDELVDVRGDQERAVEELHWIAEQVPDSRMTMLAPYLHPDTAIEYLIEDAAVEEALSRCSQKKKDSVHRSTLEERKRNNIQKKIEAAQEVAPYLVAEAAKDEDAANRAEQKQIEEEERRLRNMRATTKEEKREKNKALKRYKESHKKRIPSFALQEQVEVTSGAIDDLLRLFEEQPFTARSAFEAARSMKYSSGLVFVCDGADVDTFEDWLAAHEGEYELGRPVRFGGMDHVAVLQKEGHEGDYGLWSVRERPKKKAQRERDVEQARQRDLRRRVKDERWAWTLVNELVATMDT
jgi:flagellar biosynthesis GTPase FlhF